MLKMRREWRRTSSSQAEPSPWRHCCTSWASCSNSSSASDPGTSRPALYGTQIATQKFPGKGFGSKGLKAGQLRENEKVGQHGWRHLTTGGAKGKRSGGLSWVKRRPDGADRLRSS